MEHSSLLSFSLLAVTVSPRPQANGGGEPSAEEVVVEGGTGLFGECLREAFFDPFTEETGIEVLEAPEDAGMARVQLAVDTDNFEVDVEQLDSASQLEEFGEELLVPIDYDRVPGDEIVEGPCTYTRSGCQPQRICCWLQRRLLARR